MNTYTIDDIHDKLVRTYPPATADRELIVTPICHEGRTMCLYFTLPGTPTKAHGFASKVTHGWELSLYDSHGQRFKGPENCHIQGIRDAANAQTPRAAAATDTVPHVEPKPAV